MACRSSKQKQNRKENIIHDAENGVCREIAELVKHSTEEAKVIAYRRRDIARAAVEEILRNFKITHRNH